MRENKIPYESREAKPQFSKSGKKNSITSSGAMNGGISFSPQQPNYMWGIETGFELPNQWGKIVPN